MNANRINLKKTIWPAAILIIIALLALLPVYGSKYSVVLLISILMYIILTVSWTIFSGSTGYISLAPAAFFGVGIYTLANFSKLLMLHHIPLLAVVVIGGLVASLLAAFAGALTLRLRGIYFTIFTFGLNELIKYVLLWYEIRFTGTRGRFVLVVDNETIYWIMLGIFVVLLATAYIIRRSRFGLALRSIGEQEEAAAHSGVNVTLLKVVTFAISAFFMGAAGAIMATRWTYIDPYIAFNYQLSFLPVLMAIFGGMGQFYGPVLGAVIFAYLEELLLTRFPYYYMLLFGIVMLITILYLPGGLVGLVQKLTRRLGGGKRAYT